jgi:Kdo2-lipid IVA lauroyltransferase/acyltransferase
MASLLNDTEQKQPIKENLKDLQNSNFLSAIIYYSLIPFVYLLSLLPFSVLYFFSDCLFFIVFYVVRYRKKVVLQNLRNSFPQKTDKEINTIINKFYHNLCDFIMETIKMITISKISLQKRCKFNQDSFALFSKYAQENKSIIMAMGHIGNWEWACNSCNIYCRQQLFVIYHPIKNKYFNGLMTRIRTRSGSKLISMSDTYKIMVANKNELNATVFVADQSPQPKNAYWTNFLNQNTPAFKGVEVISRKMKLPIIYASMKKVKRGYYEMFAEVLSEHPENTLNGEISERYIRRLEQDIISQPETWLWSHRRWKHKNSAV